MGIGWKRKLASRKLWALVAGLAVALLKAFGAMPETLASVEATLGALGLVAAYLLAEGAVDAASAHKREGARAGGGDDGHAGAQAYGRSYGRAGGSEEGGKAW